MDMLRITNLKKHFGDKEVLTGLNLSVPEHSVFGFVGENGAGKTTTMKIILGLLKSDRANSEITNGTKNGKNSVTLFIIFSLLSIGFNTKTMISTTGTRQFSERHGMI